MRYMIQRLDRNGVDWEDDSKAETLDEAKGYLHGFLKHNPKYDWGGRILDTLDGTVAYEP